MLLAVCREMSFKSFLFCIGDDCPKIESSKNVVQRRSTPDMSLQCRLLLLHLAKRAFSSFSMTTWGCIGLHRAAIVAATTESDKFQHDENGI